MKPALTYAQETRDAIDRAIDAALYIDDSDDDVPDTERPPPVEAPRRLLWEPVKVLRQKWEQVVS